MVMPPLMPLGKAMFCMIGTPLDEPFVCLKNMTACGARALFSNVPSHVCFASNATDDLVQVG